MTNIPKLQAIKNLGQNFLINKLIIDKIIYKLNFYPKNDIFWIEIGPGTGNLSRTLLTKIGISVYDFLGIEYDPRMVEYLKSDEYLKKYNWIMDNACHFDYTSLKHIIKNKKIRFIGNLPYNISTKIITKILEEDINWDFMLFMVQKEVANTLIAKESTPHRNKLSVLIDYHCSLKEILLEVGPESFIPKPKVNSSFIVLSNNIDANKNFWNKILKPIVHQGFIHRRKKLSNNLKEIINNKEKIKHYLTMRAQDLSIDDWIKLATAN